MRSAVGSTTVRVVSCSFAVEPSNTTPFPSISGDVRVLFVRVCVPDVVATVESIATVTAEDPSYDVPERPVPIVRAFGFAAVIVVDPPSETEEPFTVTEEFESLSFAIEPASIVLVTVPESALVITVPVTAGNVIIPAAEDAATNVVTPVVEPFRLRPFAIYGVVIVGLLLSTTFAPDPT